MGATAAGCALTGGGKESVSGEAAVIDRSRQPLATGAIKWLNGTYTTCLDRTGSWSARVAGVEAMTHPALSVITNDSACALTLRSVVADQVYPASPDIPMTSAYLGSASSFSAGGTLRFYGNARLDTSTYGAAFAISFLFSDDPRAATDAVSSSRASVTGTASATSASAPDYTANFDGLSIQKDANNAVTSATGDAYLTDGFTTGTGYVVDNGTLAATPTFAQLDAAYNARTETAIGGANPTIGASAFSLVGADLDTPTVRTLILKRVTAGVVAYQTFAITGAETQLSAMNLDVVVDGYGPLERNRSNGELGAADGNPITLNGSVYATGLGVHAHSEVNVGLGGAFTSFISDVGVDDEVGSNGTVVFQVIVDGVTLFDSGTMTGSSATQSVQVDVTGKQQLKLVVLAVGGNYSYAHADWAGARLK